MSESPIDTSWVWPLLNARVDGLLGEATKLIEDGLSDEDATREICKELFARELSAKQAVGGLATMVVRGARAQYDGDWT